ncbi:hypothetical protein [Burkholderia anthina]|uniref:hypothetical protein n=1 Tax=Burkholderia anthina TaxID=179879 RepID=UPI0037BEF6E9
MGDKQDTFLLTDQLVRAVLGRHKTPTDDEVADLTFALVPDVLTSEQFLQRQWPGVKIRPDHDVREMIIGRDGWNAPRLPDSVVAIDVNLAEEDLLDPTNHALGPMRWIGIFHLIHALLKGLQGDLDGQGLAEGWETVVSLVGLLKPAFKTLSPVQIAVMAVAHDIDGDHATWEFWLERVNGYLNGWLRSQVTMNALRTEVAELRKKGFTVDDDGSRLRIPTTMVVVSVKRIKAVTNTLLGG